MSPLTVPCLCLVTDRRQVAPEARTLRDELTALACWLDEAFDAGIDLIQLRERDLPARAMAGVAASLAQRAAATRRTRVLINDRVDVALASGCQGVHLRSDSPPTRVVRDAFPGLALAGRSVHSPAEAAGETRADYVLFGTVFPSRSKGNSVPVQGLDRLRAAIASAPVPVLAIGGITPSTARQCAEVGAAGVAALGLFLPPRRAPGALGIRHAAAELRDVFDRSPTRHLE